MPSTDVISAAPNPSANMVTAPGYAWRAAGHTGCWWLGNPLASALRNRASRDAAAAAVVGTPVVSDAYLGLSADAYLNTALDETADMTTIVVMRTSAAGTGTTVRATLGGNYSFTSDTAVPAGTSIAQTGAAALGMYFDVRNADNTAIKHSSANGLPFTPGAWQLIAGVLRDGVGGRLYNRTLGGMVEMLESTARVVAPARKIRIGRAFNGNTGPLDIAFFGVVPRAMADVAEIDAAMVKVRQYLSEIKSIYV